MRSCQISARGESLYGGKHHVVAEIMQNITIYRHQNLQNSACNDMSILLLELLTFNIQSILMTNELFDKIHAMFIFSTHSQNSESVHFR